MAEHSEVVASEAAASTNACGISQRSVKDYVLDDFRSAQVFEKHGIDFCCGGGKSVQDACKKHGADYSVVKKELDALSTQAQTGATTPRYQDWPVALLADYIVANHHHYIKSVTPLIRVHAMKVASVHKERWPYMIEVAQIFEEVSEELDNHMMKEEKILFPRLRQLEIASQSGEQKPQIGGPIQQMMIEHDQAGELLARIRSLTNDYELPEGGCMTFRTLLAELTDYERDLHQHVFLENNVLFPKATALAD
jgi:regulator of cell morphogenesis and NO signaling